jgi:hypothetical protein
MLTLSIISCAALSSNASKGKSGAPFLLAAWKHPEYYLQILGLFLMFCGLFVPFFAMYLDMPSLLVSVLTSPFT